MAVPEIRVEAAAGAGASAAWPDPGIARQVGLGRARLGAGLWLDPVGAEVALRAVRSGGAAGYLGVDGEAVLAQVDRAQAALQLPAGFSMGAGLIGIWHVADGEVWAMPSLAGDAGLEAGLMDRSDMGGWLAFEARDRRYAARLELTSGEGAARQERNEGKDLALRLVIRPLDRPEAMELSLYGRDGSRGVALARDHRIGLRLAGGAARWSGSAEILQAWGVDGDPGRTPSLASGRIVAVPLDAPVGPLLLARADLLDEALDRPDDHRITALIGAGIAAPSCEGARWALAAGWQGESWGDQAVALDAIPGAATGRVDRLWIALDVTLGASILASPRAPFSPAPDPLADP